MSGISYILVVLIIMAFHLVMDGKHLRKRNQALTLDEVVCIRTVFMQSGPTQACTTVQAEIEMLYSVDDVIAAIGTRLDLFHTFCMPSCGLAIVNALETCNVYNGDNIQRIGELLINLCSANNGRPCYMDYTQLVGVINRGSDCFDGLQSGLCSTECRTSIARHVQNYGCCMNVPLKYINATEPADIIASVNTVFASCRITRPPACPPTAFGPVDSSVMVPIDPSIIPPTDGAGQPMTTTTILLLNSLIIVVSV